MRRAQNQQSGAAEFRGSPSEGCGNRVLRIRRQMSSDGRQPGHFAAPADGRRRGFRARRDAAARRASDASESRRETTTTGFSTGASPCASSATGFRAGLDAVMLAAAVPGARGRRGAGAGRGAGTASLCLAARVDGCAASRASRSTRSLPASSERERAVESARPCEAVCARRLRSAARPEARLRARLLQSAVPRRRRGLARRGARPGAARRGPLADWMETGVKRTVRGGTFTAIIRADRLGEALAALAATRRRDLSALAARGRASQARDRAGDERRARAARAACRPGAARGGWTLHARSGCRAARWRGAAAGEARMRHVVFTRCAARVRRGDGRAALCHRRSGADGLSAISRSMPSRAATATRDGTSGAGGIDFNYGGAPDLQLTAVVPLEYDSRAGGPETGIGNIELAAKYRFLHQDDFGWDVAVFPRVFLPSASAQCRRPACLVPAAALGGEGFRRLVDLRRRRLRAQPRRRTRRTIARSAGR